MTAEVGTEHGKCLLSRRATPRHHTHPFRLHDRAGLAFRPPASLAMPHRLAPRIISSSLLALSITVSGCGADRIATPDATSPPAGRAAPDRANSSSYGSGSSPTFLTADSTAPAMANPVIAFWAVKGVTKEVRMVYHARPGHSDSTTFLYFRVRARSLDLRPDGTPIALGDSVLITVTLVDPVALKLDFQPSGLRFAAHDSAEMRLSFKETLRDLNGDGVVNHLDSDILRSMAIWRRESPFDPWLPLPSVVLSGSYEVQSRIGGFTGYAVAY